MFFYTYLSFNTICLDQKVNTFYIEFSSSKRKFLNQIRFVQFNTYLTLNLIHLNRFFSINYDFYVNTIFHLIDYQNVDFHEIYSKWVGGEHGLHEMILIFNELTQNSN